MESDMTESSSDRLLELFQKNLKVLKNYRPDLAARFENYKPDTSFEFFFNSQGTPNLKFVDSSDFLYPASYDDPRDIAKEQYNFLLSSSVQKVGLFRHAEDSIGQLHIKYLNEILKTEESIKETNMIENLGIIPNLYVIGVGLGFFLNEILNNSCSVLHAVVIEPDTDVFFASLFTFEWENFFNYFTQPDVSYEILVAPPKELLLDRIRNSYLNIGFFNAITCNFVLHYESQEINELFEHLKQTYNYVPYGFGFFDDKLFGTSHAIRSIQNHKKFVNNSPLKKDYQNLPVFIVGSGPSLDHDLDFIRRNQDRALIVAAGTAIDILYHEGIKPDFYANTERTESISETLETIPDKSFFDDIIILCSDVCHPKTVSFFKNTAIFAKYNEPFFPFIKQFVTEVNSVQGIDFINPVVGNMAISGMLYLGFRQLYLFGLDNGKKCGTESIHSQHSVLYQKKMDSCEDLPQFSTNQFVKANFSEDGLLCETNQIYKRSIFNITTVLKKYMAIDPKTVCINCSDGAFIENTEPHHSGELQSILSRFSNIDKHTVKNYLISEKTNEIALNQELLSNLFNAKIYNKLADSVIEIISENKKNRLDYLRVMKKASYFLKNLRNGLSFFPSELLYSQLQLYFSPCIASLFASDDEEKSLRVADTVLKIIIDFLNESKNAYEKLPDYVIGEHRKYYKDGKVGIDMPHCKAPLFPEERKLVTREYDDPVKKFVKRYS